MRLSPHFRHVFCIGRSRVGSRLCGLCSAWAIDLPDVLAASACATADIGSAADRSGQCVRRFHPKPCARSQAIIGAITRAATCRSVGPRHRPAPDACRPDVVGADSGTSRSTACARSRHGGCDRATRWPPARLGTCARCVGFPTGISESDRIEPQSAIRPDARCLQGRVRAQSAVHRGG